MNCLQNPTTGMAMATAVAMPARLAMADPESPWPRLPNTWSMP